MSDIKSIGEVLPQTLAGREIKSVTANELTLKRIEWYNNSVGDLDKADGYDCEICKNRGFIAKLGESGAEVYSFCKCRKIRETLKRAERSGLGNILTAYTFNKFKATEEWQKAFLTKAKQFCEDDSANWFYVGGQVGSGKTHICTAIAAHYIKAGREVRYMLWAEDSKTLKSAANDTMYQKMIEPYKTVDVLYIDDFLNTQNGETPTTADLKLAFEIINHRLIEGDKITIISSEKMLDEIMDYSESTMSRIYQKAGNYKLKISRDKKKNYRLRETD